MEDVVKLRVGLLPVGCLAAVFGFALAASTPASAGLKLCGRDWANPDELQKQLVDVEKLKEVHRDKYYVAYQDEKATTMWTFTLPGIPAHPSVVCRMPEKDGDRMRLHMDVNCNGDERACDALVRDFRMLNSQMAKEMNKHK